MGSSVSFKHYPCEGHGRDTEREGKRRGGWTFVKRKGKERKGRERKVIKEKRKEWGRIFYCFISLTNKLCNNHFRFYFLVFLQMGGRNGG